MIVFSFLRASYAIASSNASFALDFSLVIRRTIIDQLRSRPVLSSLPHSRHSRVSRRYAREKRLWMARNTADLRDEINDTRPIPPSARMRGLFVHRSSNLSDFLRIFCHRPGRG